MIDVISAGDLMWSIRRGMQLQVPEFRKTHGWGVVAIIADQSEPGRVRWGWRTVSGGAHPDDTDVWAASAVGEDEVVVSVYAGLDDAQCPFQFIVPLTPPSDDVIPSTYYMEGMRRWLNVTKDAPDERGTFCRWMDRHGLKGTRDHGQ